MKNIVNDILIRGAIYTVVDIPDKEHDNGTLWIKMDNNLFSKEEKYVPYTEKNINKRCWDIDIKQGNIIKNSFVKGFSNITINLNKTIIYECYAKDLDYAFNKARSIIYELDELMDKLKLTNFSKLKYKKIYFKGMPSIISGYNDSGKIYVKPDCKKEQLNNWWKSVKFPYLKNIILKDIDDHENIISVDILDKRIIWERHDRRDKILKLIKNE